MKGELTTKSKLMMSVWTAYLNPLLEKHGKGELITYEDLQSSLHAAENVLQQNETSSDHASVVRKIRK